VRRCPECRRDYYDDSLLYCLDDGSALLEGPASITEPATAILHESAPPSEAATKAQIHTTERTAALQSGLVDAPTQKGRDSRLLLVPLAIVVIVLGGFFGYRYFTQAKQIESIAVMPFVNESGNPEVEYLSDGMTETLISSLSQIPNLNVKARSSVFRYKGKGTDPKAIGSELSVQAVLNGRVVQRGQDLLLNIELIDALTENVLWSQNYNRRITDLISLQSEIARDVSDKLAAKLSGTERQQFAKEYTADTEAYSLYLRGRYHFNKRTLKDVQRAIEYFHQAVGKDPNYALAFAGLADAYGVLPGYSGQPAGETAARAREAALRALALDEKLSEAHASLALIMNAYDYDFPGSEREFKRSIELDPKNAAALAGYGYVLIQLGKFDDGLGLIRKAVELEPLSLPFNRLYGMGLYYARRYRESEDHLKKTVDLDPTFVLTHYALSTVYYVQGKHSDAVESYARGLEAAGNREIADDVRRSFIAGGWKEFERSRIERHATRPRLLLAGSYAQLGDKYRAFQELESAIANRDSFITLLKVEPILDPLRDDPRFEELIRKVGFPN
jgi:TolB-like protein